MFSHLFFTRRKKIIVRVEISETEGNITHTMKYVGPPECYREYINYVWKEFLQDAREDRESYLGASRRAGTAGAFYTSP